MNILLNLDIKRGAKSSCNNADILSFTTALHTKIASNKDKAGLFIPRFYALTNIVALCFLLFFFIYFVRDLFFQGPSKQKKDFRTCKTLLTN
jgi:hypothetical protein